LLASSWSPFLRIGKTSAVFQEAEKTPLSKEALMIEVIQGTMVGKLSFSTRGGTLLIPGALLLGIELTIPLT